MCLTAGGLAFLPGNIVKPVFHGACFGAVSASTLYAPYPRRVRPNPARIILGAYKVGAETAPKPRSMENGLNDATSI